MSTDAPKDDGKKKPSLWKRMTAAPKAWSAATRGTFFLVCFMQVVVIVCWLTFQFGTTHVPWRHYMTWPRLFVVLGLMIIIPTIFYKALRLWLEGEVARFPELGKAWTAGISALRDQGITLDSAPLFLIIGSNDEQQERAIMNTHATPLSVVGIPKGPAPLHWYGNSEAIYLFCSDASWLSSLNRKRKAIVDEATAMELAALPTQSYLDNSATPAAPPIAESAPPRNQSAPAAPSTRGTIMLDQFVAPEPQPTASSGASITGTLTLDAPVKAADPKPAAPAVPKKTPAIVSSRESATQLQNLQNVCQLIRNARRPYCPVNGVLTLLPFATIDAAGNELDELQRAIRSDLSVIRTETQLRSPVTALVVGLEDELGFRELVRRVGREKSAVQRFGSRYDTRCESSPSNLSNFSTHVCGAFEDWVYTLFRERDALTRPGNPRLYSLLCKVRCILTHRLAKILMKGFADDEKTGNHEPVLFSGCYFASTGRTPDRQAFTQGVLSKLLSEQEQSEWTDRAVAQDARYRKLYVAGFAIDAALVALLATLLLL